MPWFKRGLFSFDSGSCISGFLNQGLKRASKLANIRDEPNPNPKSS